MSDYIQHILLISGAIVVALLCVISLYVSQKRRRLKATHLAEELEMELLASDNPNTLIVAGEIHDRPSTIKYSKEKSSLERLRGGFSKNLQTEKEELLVSVECDCDLDFKITSKDSAKSLTEDIVAIAMLESNGLSLESSQKAKAAFIFEAPETVHNLIELFKDSHATKLEVCQNKVTVLISEPFSVNTSPARISETLESLDRFARLLEFVADEHKAAEN